MSSYLEKHRFFDDKISDPPSADLKLIVVVPSFNEPDLESSIFSILDCDFPKTRYEIIVVLNSPEGEDQLENIHNQQQEDLSGLSSNLHFITAKNLPRKHAGVGLARKIGMDEAVSRFTKIDKKDGVIVCFDADSLVDVNYLNEINKAFQAKKLIAASVHFEHQYQNLSGEAREGIVKYEIFLRYYRNCLRWAQYPFHYHTIGSSMVVRANAYEKVGGMNKRKAGEDFYFLHKLMPLGSYGEINTTRVLPSSRVSDRVPFGTGRAMEKWSNDERDLDYLYNFQSFVDLRMFCEGIDKLYDISSSDLIEFKDVLSKGLNDFLTQEGFEEEVLRSNKNSNCLPVFRKQFYSWFNGFKVLKLIHFLRDNSYENQTVESAVQDFLNEMSITNPANIEESLDVFRVLDLEGGVSELK